jgi:predicted HD superfamily hydrolase involved in NAD metabolism
MNILYKDLIDDFEFTNDLGIDSYNLLIKYKCYNTAEHSQRVAKECKLLARKFGLDENLAEIAGYLHDISAIIPNDEKLEFAKKLEIEILKEEEEFPMILHQKISRDMAYNIWGIKDRDILSAIGCHTTLKRNASPLDLVLFIADKIQWDQEGIPPYISYIKEGLNISLEYGGFAFIKYLIEDKSNLKVIHPWLLAAYNDLNDKIYKK